MSETALWDRLKNHFAVLVRALTAYLDYAGLYAVTVKNQAADLSTVGVVFDDARFNPADGLPALSGLPGVKVKVASGARARVFFENLDPSKPRVASWDSPSLIELHVDPSVSTVFNGGTANVGRVGDAVEVTIPIGAVMIPGIPAPISNPTVITVPGVIKAGTPKVKA